MPESLAVPLQLTVGDTWSFELAIGEHPRPTWTATLYLRTAANSYSAASSGTGPDHQFTVAAATTASYLAGKYRWQLRVSDGTTKKTIDEGWIDLNPDPASAGNRDPRSWARRTLEDLESFMEGNAASAQLSMQLRDRQITRHNLKELRDWHDDLRKKVRAEESGEKQGKGRNIKVRFVRP
ncbi:MAG TPA: hypothetical protein VD932_03605 [Aquabacterium sp.]|nr:hypothetical protein [Aquabacterium sp.]